jgi:hypothetical protein
LRPCGRCAPAGDARALAADHRWPKRRAVIVAIFKSLYLENAIRAAIFADFRPRACLF